MTRPAFAPYKPRLPGTLKACISELYAQVGGVPVVMIRLARSKASVTAYSDAQSDAEISFAQVAALTGPDTTAGAEYLAVLAHGVFLPIPRVTTEVGLLTADAVRQSGEAAAHLVQALNDGVLTVQEAQQALPGLADAVRAYARLHATVSAIGRGAPSTDPPSD